jgi:predicted dithiol-disulfide oxidoreductase (DUF899 family)/predicted transcriptional regulator
MSAVAAEIDELWSAVADPTRRRVLDALLDRGEATATVLAGELPVTRQAVTKQLAVLHRAGLVESRRRGREVRHAIRPQRLDAARRSMAQIAAEWDARLSAIKSIAESAARGRMEETSKTGAQAMTTHKIGTREEWLAARKELLAREKEHTRRGDELARSRRELPWVRVEKEYTFDTDDGKRTLAQLFDGRSQLLVYHFMFGPDFEAGCPSCSSIADAFNGLDVHLANRAGATLVCVSRAPLEKLQAYKRRMGWTFPWVSAFGSDFNYDFAASFTPAQLREGGEYNFAAFGDRTPLFDADSGPLAETAASTGADLAQFLQEMPGMSAFAVSDGAVYHTYSAYARGLDGLWGAYQWLDRAPLGRNEDDHIWVRRDEYEAITA